MIVANSPRPRSAVLLLTLGVLAGARTLGRALSAFDEGFILVGAERFLHGDLPFRDFYALYPPGQYAVVAALFAVFGVHALVLRLYDVVVRSLVAWLVYRVTHRLAGPTPALAAWIGALLWTSTFGNFGLTSFPALALVLAALLKLLDAADPESTPLSRSRALVFSGCALGLGAFVRHDLAAYGLAAALPLLARIVRDGGAKAAATRFGGALVATFVPLAALVVAFAPWSAIEFEMFRYPATLYSTMRDLPYPPLFVRPPAISQIGGLAWLAVATPGIPFAAPPLLAASLALVAVAARSPRKSTPAEPVARAGALALATLALLTCNLARVRSDVTHVIPSVVVAFAVAATLVERLLRVRGGLRVALAGLVGALALTLAIPGLALQASLPTAMLRPLFVRSPDPGRASHLPAAPGLRDVAAWVRENVPPGEMIFVGCGRHDRVFASEPALYFLSGRLPGSRFHALDPGVVTTRAAQDEIVRELEANRIQFVVLSTRFDAVREPNGSSISSGVTRLDDVLRERYEPVAEFGESYVVLHRSRPWVPVEAPSATVL